MTQQKPISKTRRDLFLKIISGQNQSLFAAVARVALSAFSLLYWFGLVFHSRWTRLTATRLPCKVVSVGNLTWGGTGKTPMVEWIARRLTEMGHKVAIVSRGYGAAQDSGLNDEGKMLAANLDAVPHIQDKNRITAGKAVIKNHDPEIIVLDDGFQHRRLERDLDIVMIDATEPFGYGHLLPRGELREKPSALRRADMIVLSHCDQISRDALDQLRRKLRQYAPEVTLAESIHAPIDLYNLSEKEHYNLDWFSWNKVAAFCGVANPETFRRTLASLGCEPILFESFPDHNRYSHDQVESFITQAARAGADAVVTTQKDAVKLADCVDLRLPILQIKVELRLETGAEILTEWLSTLVSDINDSDQGVETTSKEAPRKRDVS